MAKPPTIQVDIDFTPVFDQLDALASALITIGEMMVQMGSEITSSMVELKLREMTK